MANHRLNTTKFRRAYFVVQTSPKLNVCGVLFKKTQADSLADYVYMLTGARGKIITFTRAELQKLGYQ